MALELTVRPARPWPAGDLEIQHFRLAMVDSAWRLWVHTRAPACPQASRPELSPISRIDEETAFYLARAGLPFEGRARMVAKGDREHRWQVFAPEGEVIFSLVLPEELCQAMDALSSHQLIALCAPSYTCAITLTHC